MDARAALADVRGYAAANRFRIARHAWARMAERGVQYEDVRHALATARSCRAQERGRWKVAGNAGTATSSSSSSSSRLG